MRKSIKNLELGFSDAQNYTQRENKEMFSNIFVKNSYLDLLSKSNIYYLIGEKGTGKTAYAAYLNNFGDGVNTFALKFISSTDYEKFYELKKRKQIDISGYVDIWKVILLLIFSDYITKQDVASLPFGFQHVRTLRSVIDEYYQKAFSPEIINALKITDQSGYMAKLISEHFEGEKTSGSTIESTEQQLQMNLYYICQKFSDCIRKIKLKKNITILIDGIDIRPSQIPYLDYIDCIRGLSNACWSLNTELFANVKDSKGHCRIVLLLRPDIYNSLNLQNAANKLADNAVFLEWRTTYSDYKTSYLYKMANRLLSYNQEKNIFPDIWEEYFDWDIPSSNLKARKKDTAFTEFLKISLSRPRDIQRILSILRNIMTQKGIDSQDKFDYSVFQSNQFQNEYSEYFLSSLKDQLSFYYSEEEYIHFRKFFDYFDSPQFSFDEYHNIYNQYLDYIMDNAPEIPEFMESPKSFLQLLYNSNIIVAIEKDGKYFHFSYREKSPSNIAPMVLYSPDIQYRFHYGLYKKAKLGRYNN